MHLVIHYDPVVLNDEEWNTMREIMEEIIVEVDPKLSMHDFRVVRSSKKTKLMFDLAVPYSMRSRHREIKAQIDTLLAERGKDYKTVISFDETA